MVFKIKSMKYIISALIIFVLLQKNLIAQSECVIYNTNEQPSLKTQHNRINDKLIELPFFDDFAYIAQTPLQTLWYDSYAMVNSSFGKNPITIGVLTLDALNEKGRLYTHVSTSPQIADYATSLAINLYNYRTYYNSDKLYVKVNDELQKINDNFYLYHHQKNMYVSVVERLKFASGDTLYIKSNNKYEPYIDSVFDNSVRYIEGSKTFVKHWQPYIVQDSLAFSFYYQSGGNGDMPESADSLVLEFSVPSPREGIFINEISQKWIEFYNASDTIVNLKNYFIVTDTLQSILDSGNIELYKITEDFLIAPYSFKIYNGAKDYTSNNPQSWLVSPVLSVIDSVILSTEFIENSSFARIPDGSENWEYAPTSTPNLPNSKWQWMWSSSEHTGDYFNYVYIPIDTNFHKKGFRFRFKNYVSLSSDASHARNEDFWNIDMVWLDAHRKSTVKNPSDVAFLQNIAPLYNAFTALPITHFDNVQSSNFRLTIDANFQNFDSVDRKVKFNFDVKKINQNTSIHFPTYETDIPPYMLAQERDMLLDWDVDFLNFIKDDIGIVKEETYEFQYYFTDNDNILHELYRWNDTSRTQLTLSNYYAYDDGVPKAGYGLRQAPLGKVALKYSSLQPDTLTAIAMYFNPTKNEAPPIFTLCVWEADEHGMPGKLLYKKPGTKVAFANSRYGFVYYPIESDGIIDTDASEILICKDFFIGWEQPYDVLLNVGLDLSSSLKNKIFYNLGLEWEPSVQNGALMIRPVFGKLLQYQQHIVAASPVSIILYPTVTQDLVYVQNDTNVSIQSIEIYSILGTKIQVCNPQSRSLSLAHLPQGIYYIRIKAENNIVTHQKIILKK